MTSPVRHLPVALPGRRRAALACLPLLLGAAWLAPAAAAPTDQVVGLFTGDLRGVEREVAELEVSSHRFRHFDVVAVAATPSQLDAITRTTGRRWWANERQELLSEATNAQIGAAALHVAGVDGRGTTVAVVDTGIDATLPDLLGRVTHNIKVLGTSQVKDFELVGETLDLGPGSNTDIAAGHGTAVSAIVAAEGRSRPELRGVAPAASLVGYALGAGPLIVGDLVAYDDILEHPERGVDVVNNSFGPTVWQDYDPETPNNVATLALHRAGIVTVNAAGNSGELLSQSPASLAPWLVAAGASRDDSSRSAVSSQGIPYDASTPEPLTDGHRRWEGDRVGMYRPTVLAPGESVSTLCTPTDTFVVSPCAEGSGAATGTSFAAPHLSGVLALLKQVRPTITPTQSKRVLEVTAQPVEDVNGTAGSGYGEVDAGAAVALARRPGFVRDLARLAEEADARVLGARPWSILSTDHWTFRAQPAGTESRDLHLAVDAATQGLSVSLGHPSPGGYAGVVTSSWSVTVLDAAGTVVASTVPQGTWNSAHVVVDLRGKKAVPGLWTLRVTADRNTGEDPVVLALLRQSDSYVVMLAVSRLEAQLGKGESTPRGSFVPTGTLALPLRVDPARPVASGARSAEGCDVDPALQAGGLLSAVPVSVRCVSGGFGQAATNTSLGAPGAEPVTGPAVFTSAPFGRETVLGGQTRLVVDVADTSRTVAAQAGLVGRVLCALTVLLSDGTVRTTGELECALGVVDGRNRSTFATPTLTVPRGARLRVELESPGGYTAGGRLLFDGADHGAVGLVFQTGRLG